MAAPRSVQPLPTTPRRRMPEENTEPGGFGPLRQLPRPRTGPTRGPTTRCSHRTGACAGLPGPARGHRAARPPPTWRCAPRRWTGPTVDQGITFSLSGQERPFPLDIVPRVISAARVVARCSAASPSGCGRWRRSSPTSTATREVVRRRRACPRALITSCEHFHRAAAGLEPAQRRAHPRRRHRPRPRRGRAPSGCWRTTCAARRACRYVMENRRAMARVFPEPVRDASGSRRSATTRRHLLRALRAAAAPDGVDDPTVVVLTPGVHNSAYFEHALLARTDGRRAGRGPRPGLPRQPCLHAHHRGRAAGRRDLPPDRRRVPRPAAVPRRTRCSAARADQRGPGRQRHDRQRRRQRRRRRQARLHLRAGHDRVLPRRGTDACPTSTPTGWRARTSGPTCWTGSTSWCSSRSTAPAATARVRPERQRRGAAKAAPADPRRPARLDRPAGRAALDRADPVDDRLVPRHVDLRPFAVNDGENVCVLPGDDSALAPIRTAARWSSSSQGSLGLPQRVEHRPREKLVHQQELDDPLPRRARRGRCAGTCRGRPHERSTVSQAGDDIRSDTRDSNSRTTMSTRSTERPSR